MMYYAMKGNKQLKITEPLKEEYRQLGYDIYRAVEGKEAELVAHGAGKTVAFEQYEAVVEKVEALEALVAEAPEKIEALERENEALKKQVAELGKPKAKSGEKK